MERPLTPPLRPQRARRGPGLGRSHWAEIERSQRGALSAPFPSPPAGPAPCFWRRGGGLRFAARHPLLLARAGKVAQIGSAAVTIAEALVRSSSELPADRCVGGELRRSGRP